MPFGDIKVPNVSPVMMRDLGGVMAGSMIASAILDTLMRKNVLSLADVRETVRNARNAIGQDAVGALDNECIAILDWMLKVRFADDSVGE